MFFEGDSCDRLAAAMSRAHPVASREETIAAILGESERPGRVPLRNVFLQLGPRGPGARPGPMAEIVRRGRERTLEQYLLAVTLATGHPHDVNRDSRIWARAVGLPESASGRAAVSRSWSLLRELKLVRVARRKRLASVTLLREDGSGAPYTHPSQDRRPSYLQLPFEYWFDDFYTKLSLAAKAILLIALSLPDRFPLPTARTADWYGISESTAARGLRELRDAGLLTVEREEKTAPLAPKGYTLVNFYTLQPPFGPKKTLPWRKP
jgi:DNA-binding transcriptional ArsR family regulator